MLQQPQQETLQRINPKTHLQNNPPHLPRRFRNIHRAPIKRIRRDGQQLGRQLDRTTKLILGFCRFALARDQRLGRLEEVAGVGVRHGFVECAKILPTLCTNVINPVNILGALRRLSFVSLVCFKLDGDFEVGSSARARKLRILGCNALLLSLLEPVVGVVTCEETLILHVDT